MLPFGLSTAGSIFTKFLRPLIKRWRAKGIKVVLYLDNGIITHGCILERQVREVHSDL